jgi:hypothetical protein
MSDARIRKGRQAAVELELTEAAFVKSREELIEAWEKSRDPMERERLHAQVLGLKMVRDKLLAHVNAGKIAAAQD